MQHYSHSCVVLTLPYASSRHRIPNSNLATGSIDLSLSRATMRALVSHSAPMKRHESYRNGSSARHGRAKNNNRWLYLESTFYGVNLMCM